MTSSYSKTSVFVFVRLHVNEKPAFSKLFTLESVYKKMLFWRPFTSVNGRPNRRKNFRFKKKTEFVLRDQVFPFLTLSTGYQILTNSFYLMIIVNWRLTFTVCPKPDSKFL